MLANNSLFRNTNITDKLVSFVKPVNKVAEKGISEISSKVADIININSKISNKSSESFSFVEDSQIDNKKKGSYSSTWKLYRDAENQPDTVSSTEELKNKLGLNSDWKLNTPLEYTFFKFEEAKDLEKLVNFLEKNGLANAKNLSYIERIANNHSLLTVNNISRSLNNYLSKNPTAEQKTLVQDALHDLAYPSDIDQKNKNTCSTAAIQMKLAIEKPTEYVDILTSLAKGKTYKMASGNRLNPNNSWRSDSGDNRRLSAKIMENSMMEFAFGGNIMSGVNIADLGIESYKSSPADDEGLSRGQQEKLLENLFGKDYDNDSSFILYDKEDLFSFMEDDIARGRTVSISFDGHAVLVVGLDKSGPETKVIMNSWGEQYSMTKTEFKKYLEAVRSLDDKGSDNHKTAVGSKIIYGDK